MKNEEAPKSINPETNLVQTGVGAEAVARTGPVIVNMEKLADEFSVICSADLEKELTPEKIRESLIQKGFPAGLASSLGSSLLERITDARQTLAVATTKPKFRDSLVAAVREEVIGYFQTREAEIVRFFEVLQDPTGYLKIISSVFSHIDEGRLSQLSDSAVVEILSNVKILSVKVANMVLVVAATKIVEAGISELRHLKISRVEPDVRNGCVDITIMSERPSNMDDFFHRMNPFLEKNYDSVINKPSSFSGGSDNTVLYL